MDAMSREAEAHRIIKKESYEPSWIATIKLRLRRSVHRSALCWAFWKIPPIHLSCQTIATGKLRGNTIKICFRPVWF